MKRRWTVIQFPGSNCDADALKAIRLFSDIETSYHWHQDPIPKKHYEVIIIPGGFSFGDYLRAGAIAKLSAAMASLPDAIEAGAHVLGICNGFQILVEARLLPGFLHVNQNLRFISKVVELSPTEDAFPWFKKSQDVWRFPIAHRFGNYQVPAVERRSLVAPLRYTDNPNGSFESIAGVYRPLGSGSILGMMPHPERACFPEIDLADGAKLFRSAYKELKS